ncbi:MAG: hypothetical protein ATN35_02970 [Epulopiscium sp. Nele67-Bin004]|nr:MAG: hypothetical protein ATN35_02970 [Epulopiscium sp. Nele67-Bin004]
MLIIKVESSKVAGVDPVHRMGALAGELIKNTEVVFLCRKADSFANKYLTEKGFNVISYAEGEHNDIIRNYIGATIIIDSREKVGKFDENCRTLLHKIIYVTEDLKRSYRADLVINPTAGANSRDHMTIGNCEKWTGTDYTIIRQEYLDKPVMRINENVKNVLIVLGEVQSNTITRQVIDYAKKMEFNFKIVLDNEIKQRDQILLKCGASNITFHSPDEIETLVDDCDVTICGGLNLIYELGAIGMPVIFVVLTREKVTLGKHLLKDNLSEAIGIVGIVEASEIMKNLTRLALNYDKRLTLQKSMINEFRKHSTERLALDITKFIK